MPPGLPESVRDGYGRSETRQSLDPELWVFTP